MAVTFNLARTMNWAKPYLKNQPQAFSNNEPALETGNMVMQAIFCPPLRYRWNRRTFTFPTVANVSDYTQALPQFGFLETQWISDSTGKTYPLKGSVSLPKPTSTSPGRPTEVSPQYDDNLGNITFRTKELPNAVYTLAGDYQAKPPVLLSLAQPLAPLSDDFRVLFDWGYLAIISLLVDDPRMDYFERKFIGGVLSRQDGLDDQAKNIFLDFYATNIKTLARAQTSVQAGAAGRATGG